MSSTETDRARTVASELFDEVTRLAQQRSDAGRAASFPLGPDPAATSYFEPAACGTLQPSDFEFPGDGTAAGLLDSLSAYWQQSGEPELAALVPQLKEIAQAVTDEATAGDGSISILCYTMF